LNLFDVVDLNNPLQEGIDLDQLWEGLWSILDPFQVGIRRFAEMEI